MAAWALRRDLSGLNVADLLRQLRSYGVAHLAIGLACTAGSFVALGVVELLALAYVERDEGVPRRMGMTTALVANAFSQSIGLALLTGGAVRLRAYARYQLDAADVARVSAFVTLTVTLGLLATGAGAFLASTAPLLLGIGYGTVLRVYLVAQTVGVLSHVPGGVGVFELLVLTLLTPVTGPEQRAAVVASLVVFRALCYLLPLVAALAIATIAELRFSRRSLPPGLHAD